jgi:exodeoxyribonuclease V beta subunit
MVQIVTIHKSKGLEYPLVWLPFIAVSVNRIRRHDQRLVCRGARSQQAEASVELAEAERLAEDLRLCR